MTIRVREWTKGKQVGFEVDIRFTYPDGTPFRRRIKAPVESKSAAKRWAEAKERELLLSPPPRRPRRAAGASAPAALKEVPTLEEFWPTFIDRYCKAERQKPSTVATKQWAFKKYIRPTLGSRRLDAIGPREIQDLKAALSEKTPKASNNVLTVLSACLKFASAEGLKGHEGLGIIEAPPRVRMLRARQPEMAFYEIPEYQRLLGVARAIDVRTELAIRLAGDAGLRRGEILALRWKDVDLSRGVLHVRQNDWEGHIDTPKSGKDRTLALTAALRDLLAKSPRRGERVIATDAGAPADKRLLRKWITAAQKAAGLRTGIHIIRHTCLTAVGALGAPLREIQKLAGHGTALVTTRYLHASHGAADAALLLDRLGPPEGETFGEILETPPPPTLN